MPDCHQRYFVCGRVAGTPHRRYAVLCERGRTVVAVQASRPDGIEIAPPAGVRWQVQPFLPPARSAAAPASYNNVHAAALSRARQRAGIQGGRASQQRNRAPKETP